MRRLRSSELLGHRRFVRGLALSLTGEPESAEDLAQEALLIGLKHPPDDQGATRAWLGQVVRRLAWRRFRSERARDEREQRAQGERLEATELPASYDAAQAETRLLLAQALDALEPIYRDVLVLRFYEGLPPREIAARLELPVETVRTRLKRGLERMRHKLEGRFGDREVWGLVLLGLAGVPHRRAASFGLAAAAGITALLLPALWWGLRAPSPATPALALAPAADAPPTELLAPLLPAASSVERTSLEAPLEVADVPAQPPLSMGRVLTPDGAPAVGARVRFQWPEHYGRAPEERTTDAAGRFELPEDPRSGAVCAWHDDWGTCGLLSGKDPMFEKGFELELFEPWPHAEGFVLDSEGAPVPDARVYLTVASNVGRTIAPRRWGVVLPEPFDVDADGGFAVPSVPLGTYWIHAEAPGFAPCSQLWLPVEDVARFELRLVRGRNLSGTLRLSDGRPAAGAQVEVEAPGPFVMRSTRADDEGRFEFVDLPVSRVGVRAWWSDGEQGWLARRVLRPADGERATTWNAELAPGGVIRGWALTADDGVPSGWSVTARADEREVQVEIDEFGGFLVTGWDEPVARLELRDGDSGLRALAEWREGREEIELRENPGRLVGEVHFADAAGSAGALLLVRHAETDDEHVATFDAELGRLDVGGLAPGDWRLLRWLPERRSDEIGRYSVRAGETTDFGVLEVPALARLDVDVSGERGGHVRLLRRMVDGSMWPEAERRVSQADASGMLTFEVSPAAYEVRIGGISSAATAHNVVLRPGVHDVLVPEPRELVDCTLCVRRPSSGPGGMLDLRVIDPRYGVEVILQRRPVRAGDPLDVCFEVALPAGEWLLRARSRQGRVERPFRTDALDDDTVFELRKQ